jgi:hypothetical protein
VRRKALLSPEPCETGDRRSEKSSYGPETWTVPMLFSVGSRCCRERRRMVRVDDEGQFRAVHFRPKQTDRWHPHELFSKMKFHFKAEGHPVMREDGYPFASRRLWILQWAGSCAWDHLHGNQYCLSLRKGCFLWVIGPTTIGAYFCSQRKGSNQLLKLLYFYSKITAPCGQGA